MSFGYITRQAYSYYGRTVADQHLDYFTRNILVTRCGCGSCSSCIGGGSSEVAARNKRRSNVPWCPWPTYEEVMQWANSEGIEASRGRDETSNSPALEAALLAAIDSISDYTGLPYFVVDDAFEVVVDVDGNKTVAEVPPAVHQATVMHAYRLYRRRLSPDGTLGASAFGGAVRVSRFDPDIDRLLAPYKRRGIA